MNTQSGQPAKPVKPWSILAYVVADDEGPGLTLDNRAKHELVAICSAAAADEFIHVSVATQVDFKFQPGVYRASINPPPSRGFNPVEPDRLWRSIQALLPTSSTGGHSTVLNLEMNAEDLNAASGDVLQDFIAFGRTECPADRQVIYFYGHASGPMGLFWDADVRNGPKALRLFELADAVRRGERDRPASVLVFRDCWMNTLEAAYQLRSVAEYMIASQSEVPANGAWPWNALVAALQNTSTTEDSATALVEGLAAFFDQESNRYGFADAPVSLLHLAAAGAIAEPLKQLTTELVAVRDSHDQQAIAVCSAALEGARGGFPNDPSKPGDPALVDVLTLCMHLEKAPAPVAAAADRLAEAVKAMVTRHHSQAPNSPYTGSSLYYKPLPDGHRSFIQTSDHVVAAADAIDYQKLALVEETGWWQIAMDPLTPT